MGASLALVAYAVMRAQTLASEPNVGAIWNGLGAVSDVLRRRAMAPMAYRALVPILLAPVPVRHRRAAYDVLLWAGAWAMLETVARGYGLTTALVLAALLPLTFRFDYWDWIPEMAALAAVSSGQTGAALGWGLLAGMSRETAMVGAIVGGWPYAVAVAIGAGAVRVWQGPHELYCSRWMLARNWRELREGGRTYSDWSCTLAVTLIGALASVRWGVRGLPFLALLGAGWTMAVARETRVFAAVLLPVAAWIGGG